MKQQLLLFQSGVATSVPLNCHSSTYLFGAAVCPVIPHSPNLSLSPKSPPQTKQNHMNMREGQTMLGVKKNMLSIMVLCNVSYLYAYLVLTSCPFVTSNLV